MTADKKTARQKKGEQAYKLGFWAEFLCRLALRIKGYRILVARYKTHQGEIDIIAARGKTLVFVEVKARQTLLDAAAAVSLQQQNRLGRAASLFLAHTRGFSRYHYRFDVMLVLPRRWPQHIQNAFTVEVRSY